MLPSNNILICPQPGPQTEFCSTIADVALFGGAAGGGKSFGLLLDPLYDVNNPKFGAVCFRRNTVQVKNQGGLWDESYTLYSPLGAHPREHLLEWEFQSGMRVKFAHLENEHTVYDWQGAQIPWIGFDELVHFTAKQFWYMFSRNRSMSGVPGRIRATCNPDCDSWVRELVDWWIGPDGFPIKERSGKLRWFIRQNDELIWADTKKELVQKFGEECLPQSFTFIPSKIHDNKILMGKDPSYLAKLKGLSRVDRERLLDGNWNVRASAGSIFRKEWFPVVDAIPSGWIRMVRYWDRAASRVSEVNRDPDWTRGLKLYKYPNGSFVVVDLKSIRGSPGEVEQLVKNTASHDSYVCPVVGEQDPGSAGVADAQNFVRMLAGFNVETRKVSNDKVTRAKPVSAQAEAGNIRVLRSSWSDVFFTELENFPDGGHDDIVDALSGAFNELATGISICDVL